MQYRGESHLVESSVMAGKIIQYKVQLQKRAQLLGSARLKKRVQLACSHPVQSSARLNAIQ